MNSAVCLALASCALRPQRDDGGLEADEAAVAADLDDPVRLGDIDLLVDMTSPRFSRGAGPPSRPRGRGRRMGAVSGYDLSLAADSADVESG